MEYDIAGQTDADHLWLEEVEGEKALATIQRWNEHSAQRLQGQVYQTIKAELLEVFNSAEKIPYISFYAGNVYNFWQDEQHVRGIWRITTLESYRSQETQWQTLLDIDALATKEGKNWVYKGNSSLAPDYSRCMISLSDGGKDAVVRREFDITQQCFVEDGFITPESKGNSAWLSEDQRLISIDFDQDEPESSLTDSGYPMISKLWQRGTDLSNARELMCCEKTDVSIYAVTFDNAQGTREIMTICAKTFYERDYYWIPQTGVNAFKPQRFPLPTKASLSEQFNDQQLFTLQEEWRGYPSGTLLSFSLGDFMQHGTIDALYEVMRFNERQSLGRFSAAAKSAVLLSVYDNISATAYALTFDGTQWHKKKIAVPTGSVYIANTHAEEDIAFIDTNNFLTPDTQWMVNTNSLAVEKLKALPDWFDASTMQVQQLTVASSDGVKIPYFVVHDKAMPYDGTNPTLLYGYGGFEVSLSSHYSASVGRTWLARGGVYVLANIRGGGEFGPNWHQQGLKTQRQIIYDDFIAIAEDLIQRKITSPEHLGAHGASNGGLLMGVMFTQRPDLFKAIACGVPLLDMMRYHKLLAGASWMGEYGDPDDATEGAFLRSISPYHQLKFQQDYPEIYLYTSTKDDRVHPAHARKFAQRLTDLGYDFLYYENMDGGHGAAANLEEIAHNQAQLYAYFIEKLMLDEEPA